MPRDFQDLKDGDQLEPVHINVIYKELRRWRRAYAVPPMVIDGLMSSDSPPIFRAGLAVPGFPAIASGNINARVNSTAGIGLVVPVTGEATYNGVTLTSVTLSNTNTTFSVVNVSSNTMTSGHGIDSGMYCWVEEGPDGLLYVAPLECS